MSATVDIFGETFDRIAWKERFQSFYVRRSDGELRVIELEGMRKPRGRGASLFDSDPVKISAFSVPPFLTPGVRCEFANGQSVILTGCTSSAPSLLEMEQLRNLASSDLPIQHAETPIKPVSAQLSTKRSNAARSRTTVKDREDRAKIKKAFWARLAEGEGVSKNAAANDVANLLVEGQEKLGLSQDYILSGDGVKRIAKVKK